MIKKILYIMSVLLLSACNVFTSDAEKKELHYSDLKKGFLAPPDAFRPGVYWYFMDGNQTREAMTSDLHAMHKAGLRKVLFLEVDIGVPRGPVPFMSELWQDNFVSAVHTADELGLEIILGTGPGWSGSGGPWIEPAQSMQHLRASSLQVSGPAPFTGVLPIPDPREPSRFAGLSDTLTKVRQGWHADVAVLAFPTPIHTDPPELLDVKTLYETQPYTIWKHIPRFIQAKAVYSEPPELATIDPSTILDISEILQPDGSLAWDIPPGEWTIMRFAARSTGATTRPAPLPGHGFETDKFSSEAFHYHFQQFHQKLLDKIGPRRPGRGWTGLHLDSWEMSSQNWSSNFRNDFLHRRGYDPQPFFPAYTGLIVGSREKTERFLWDLRLTAQELVIENHAKVIRQHAHDNDMLYSNQPYDMNPASNIELGAIADVISCEFWTTKNDAVYGCVEAVSIAHTTGQPVVRAEAFTSPHRSGYQHNPADLKDQTDWAFALGINDIIFHTYQHQPLGIDDPKPGMAMGPYGVHWHRNQTFWPMVNPYHDYIARCGYLLQQGVAVADILYLTPEGAPHIFLPPDDAMRGSGLLREKKAYNFDAVSPGILMKRGEARNGQIAFPGGTSYRILVLPAWDTMTPDLLEKINDLILNGITVVGLPPIKSPSLENYPDCDRRLEKLAMKLWGGYEVPVQITEINHGKGKIIWGGNATPKTDSNQMYPSYESTTALLQAWGIPAGFESTGPIRFHHRRMEKLDIFFVSNREARSHETVCTFRTDGTKPELWNPVTGKRRKLPEFSYHGNTCSIPLHFARHESYFVVFDRKAKTPVTAKTGNDLSAEKNFPIERILAVLEGPYEVSFDPLWGGPNLPVTFSELNLWNNHELEGIRYYSGEAVYSHTFDRPDDATKNTRLLLDLGVVHKLARVRLNGEDLGIVWTAPFKVDVTGKLNPTNNKLEVTVVNTWVNRLIGDQQPENKGVRELQWESGLLAGRPHQTGRYTFTTVTIDYNAGSPLQESGLQGPVRIVSVHAK